MTAAANINNQTTFRGVPGYGRSTTHAQNQQRANRLFQQASQQARRHKITAWLRRREYRLWHLHPATPLQQVRASQTETVSLAQIKGSANARHQDFDNQFQPLQNHTKSRWINIAVNSQRELPPVDLIQVGGVYFVVDGHHRISVANALGQTDITANVTVYTIEQPQ